MVVYFGYSKAISFHETLKKESSKINFRTCDLFRNGRDSLNVTVGVFIQSTMSAATKTKRCEVIERICSRHSLITRFYSHAPVTVTTQMDSSNAITLM